MRELDTTSYPMLVIANRFDLSYGTVLNYSSARYKIMKGIVLERPEAEALVEIGKKFPHDAKGRSRYREFTTAVLRANQRFESMRAGVIGIDGKPTRH